MARRKRADNLVDRDLLLSILGSCRHDLAVAMARMKIDGPLYRSTAEVLASIDAMALVLTNRPDYLHGQPHRTP